MAKKKKDITESSFESFESVLSKSEQYIIDNQKIISIIVGIIFVIVAGFLGFRKLYLAPLEDEAKSQMFMAEKYFEMDSFDLAIYGDGNYLGFIDIINDYSLTKTARLAHYYMGICNLRMGLFEDAIEHLKKFHPNDKIVGPVALGAIGDAYSELDDYETALTYYLKAAKKSENKFTTPIFLMKAAMAHEYLGEISKALNLYQQIYDDYPDTQEARQAEKYIAKLQATMDVE